MPFKPSTAKVGQRVYSNNSKQHGWIVKINPPPAARGYGELIEIWDNGNVSFPFFHQCEEGPVDLLDEFMNDSDVMNLPHLDYGCNDGPCIVCGHPKDWTGHIDD